MNFDLMGIRALHPEKRSRSIPLQSRFLKEAKRLVIERACSASRTPSNRLRKYTSPEATPFALCGYRCAIFCIAKFQRE
ncbi:hypothetical protein ABH943_008630, partial [Caballeronia udeis]